MVRAPVLQFVAASLLCTACGGCTAGEKPSQTPSEQGRNSRHMTPEQDRIVRRARGSGRWFPASRSELKQMVTTAIEEADVPEIGGTIVAAVAPHAGYVYSGPVAGYTFQALKQNAVAVGQPDTVVVLGLSHRAGFPGVALMDGDIFETPLGRTDLDVEGGALLANSSERIGFAYDPHAGEHSAENEIPFVQVACPESKLIVGIIGDHDRSTVRELVRALDKLAETKRIVVVASTDLLHDPDYDKVRKTDQKTLESIVALDDSALLDEWDFSNQTCCGIAPVLTAIGFAKVRGCKTGTLLHYRNSGDDHPESRGSWVVGYGAVVFSSDR